MGGGTLGLSGGDQAPLPPQPEPAPSAPTPSDTGGGVPAAVGLGATALMLAVRRRDDLAPGDALSLEEPPLVVFVPGHGQGDGARVFADLLDQMGIDEDSARYFDYRWAAENPEATMASQSVRIDDAATSLNSYLAGLAENGQDMYVVGFSKGGATLAELIADWDDGRWGPADSVLGATLLDPPIATGPHGWLQSLGRRVGPIPDDGGYDPEDCVLLGLGCTDRREGLGQDSGVDVMVIRNPKAGVTSFSDLPEGLRVYDAADDGPTPLEQMFRNPLGVPGRIAQAHESVLHDRSVAECIVAEIRGGRCDLPQRGRPARLPSLRRPAMHSALGPRVL